MFFKKKKSYIYADHAAATPLDSAVFDAMKPYWSDNFHNPSAVYAPALDVKKRVNEARHHIASLLSVQSQNIFFTHGATESVNLAIQGTLHAWKKNNPQNTPHIIISALEHEAVFEQVQALHKRGWCTYDILPIDKEGIVLYEKLKELITPSTVLISIMYANNEIGTIQPIREITKTVRWWKKHNKSSVYPLVHTDAVQAPLYLDMHIPRLGVDLLTTSAAKIYGPKGIALLYVKHRDYIEPVIFGGAQEHGLRSGTENVPLIIGFEKALDKACSNHTERYTLMQKKFELIIQKISKTLPEARINGSLTKRLPHNINISVPSVMSEELVIRLDADGIACSSQSACSSDKDTSRIIQALHPDEDPRWGGVRFTFGDDITQSHIDTILASLKKNITLIQETQKRFRNE